VPAIRLLANRQFEQTGPYLELRRELLLHPIGQPFQDAEPDLVHGPKRNETVTPVMLVFAADWHFP